MDSNIKIKPPQDELNLEKRIAQLRMLRAKMEEIERKHKEELNPYTAAKKALEGALMNWLLERSIKTANTKAGNITWVDNTTFIIEDKVAFRQFVIENQEWEIIDWKANKTAVEDFKEGNNGTIPPGLRPNPHPHLRVSGPGKKETPTTKKGFSEDTPEEE